MFSGDFSLKKAIMENNKSSLYAKNENEASRKADNQPPLNVPGQQLVRPSSGRGKRKAADHSPLLVADNDEDPMLLHSSYQQLTQQEGIEQQTIEQQEAKFRGEEEMRALEQPPDKTLNWTRDE